MNVARVTTQTIVASTIRDHQYLANARFDRVSSFVITGNSICSYGKDIFVHILKNRSIAEISSTRASLFDNPIKHDRDNQDHSKSLRFREDCSRLSFAFLRVIVSVYQNDLVIREIFYSFFRYSAQYLRRRTANP